MNQLCVVCPVYRQQPAQYRVQHVCDPCEARMARQLVQVSDEWLLLDATPGGGRKERVSGSSEAPIGARIDVLDQLIQIAPQGHARIMTEGDLHISDATYFVTDDEDLAELDDDDEVAFQDTRQRDQIGDVPAVVVLDLIASHWLETRRRDGHQEHRPVPTVPNLTAWLRDRLGWACSHLPDSIDAHADEIRQLCGRLHALNGNVKEKTEPIPATPCRHCGHIALVRVDGRAMCTNCSQYSGSFADAIATAIVKITDQQAA